MPKQATNDVDMNATIAPNFDSHESQGPNQTQVPLSEPIQSTKSKHTISEKQTFYFAGNLAHFEIHEILGQGGMGAVYHAKDKTLHRDVAIKMLRPMAASSQINTEALLDEARLASKLNHPNIVTIYDVARNQDSNYIVMEWIDGQSLDEIIPLNGLKLEKALEYACQIADGLANAHQKYIIHRDIKPHNIMLSPENTIKILDFGIAGYLNQSTDDSENSDKNLDNEQASEQTSTGTPSYMSPEQAKGLNLDQRSDIFSFGIVLYQMLCGKRPFIGKNFTELKEHICTGRYTPIQQQLPELPLNIVQLVNKMLATAKDQRWQSSAELAEALHNIYDKFTYKKNWWQRRGWLSKAAIILPFVLAIGWSSKEILFPASTQQLIERQLQEANKIAILPFENISGDPEIQLFGDGLAVNLGSDLAAIASYQGNTWIVPSTEISRMKDQSLKAVADKYGVNIILTGSIQHMGSTRLMVLNLLDASTGQQVKTTEISIDAENLFQGYDQIRAQALHLLDWSIPNDLKTKFESQRPQLDGAYKEYVKGQGYLYRYDQIDNLNNALNAFKNSIKLDENYEKAYVGLSESYLNKFIKTKNVDWLTTMELTIKKLQTLNSKNNQINFLFAEIAMQKGEYQNAVKLYKESVRVNPKHIQSQIGLAKALNKNGNIEMAEKIYQKAIKSAPNNWSVVLNFGIFYFQNGNYKNSQTQFKRLIEMSPNNLYGYRLTAASNYYLGDIKTAIVYTKKAIDINPTDEALANLGTMLFSIEKYKDSIDAYKKALELNDTSYLIWGNLADAYKLNKNKKNQTSYKNAISIAKDSLRTNPNDSTVKAALAYYLANLQKTKEALFFAEQIGEQNTGYDNYFVATAFDQLGMIDKTLWHLKIAIEKNYPLKEIKNTPLLKNSRKDIRFLNLIKN
jgi:serine/threonine-protein kinase